jgi:dienelactone hydrolase
VLKAFAIVCLLFVSEEIQFTNGGTTLSGRLDLPAGNARSPLVVFVHGSGQRTREDYEPVAQQLIKAGYAVFRYDKRGVGKSKGDFIEVGTYNSNERIPMLAADAVAAIKKLKSHPRIDPKKIIVMGGSQAGWIIPVVASLTDVRATVLISGPTVSVGEEIYYSDLAEHGSQSQEAADKMLKDFKGPRGFDNTSYVAKMNKPSFWIFGGKDVSIPVRKCITRLDSISKATKLPIDMKIYPEADHGIFNQATRKSEDYISEIIKWLNVVAR